MSKKVMKYTLLIIVLCMVLSMFAGFMSVFMR